MTLQTVEIRAAGRGIDIKAKAGDIRRIVFAKFHVEALDRDDLLQEVLFAIHRKNSSEKSAYDPTRAAFSTYVYRVACGIVGHMLEAPRWRNEAAEEGSATDDLRGDDMSPIEIREAAEEAGIDVEASRELGELVALRPRQFWELALEQRAGTAPPPAPRRATANDHRLARVASHVELVAGLRAALAEYDARRPPAPLLPLPRRSLRVLCSWFVGDLAELAPAPLAGYIPCE